MLEGKFKNKHSLEFKFDNLFIYNTLTFILF